MAEVNEEKVWMWLINTNKGEFFMTVAGKWTQEEAANRVQAVFKVMLKLEIVGMIPRLTISFRCMALIG